MRPGIVFAVLVLLLAIAAAFSVALGSTGMTLQDLAALVFMREGDPMMISIIWGLRIPRVFSGIVIGAALAVCGVVFQATLRNPLAEPYTLGVSSGGALGATVSIMLGISGMAMVGVCFLGCCMTTALVIGIASLKGFSNVMLILCGVIIGFLLSSIMMLLFSLSSTRDVYASIMWLMGSLSAPNRLFVMVLGYGVLPLSIILNIFSKDLNILSLGDDKAMYLGLNAKTSRIVLFTITSIITGACVAVAGVISFVGLIVPHIMRGIIGAEHRLLMPSSMLAGAIMLLVSDTIARLIISPMELPVGVITGICGGIFFLALLFRKGEETA